MSLKRSRSSSPATDSSSQFSVSALSSGSSDILAPSPSPSKRPKTPTTVLSFLPPELLSLVAQQLDEQSLQSFMHYLNESLRAPNVHMADDAIYSFFCNLFHLHSTAETFAAILPLIPLQELQPRLLPIISQRLNSSVENSVLFESILSVLPYVLYAVGMQKEGSEMLRFFDKPTSQLPSPFQAVELRTPYRPSLKCCLDMVNALNSHWNDLKTKLTNAKKTVFPQITSVLCTWPVSALRTVPGFPERTDEEETEYEKEEEEDDEDDGYGHFGVKQEKVELKEVPKVFPPWQWSGANFGFMDISLIIGLWKLYWMLFQCEIEGDMAKTAKKWKCTKKMMADDIWDEICNFIDEVCDDRPYELIAEQTVEAFDRVINPIIKRNKLKDMYGMYEPLADECDDMEMFAEAFLNGERLLYLKDEYVEFRKLSREEVNENRTPVGWAIINSVNSGKLDDLNQSRDITSCPWRV